MRVRSDMPVQRAASAGFTLIELLVVVALIALMITMLMPMFGRTLESAKRTKCSSNQQELIFAATAAALDNGQIFPTLGSAGGHITWIDSQSYMDLGGYLDVKNITASDRENVRYEQFYCPNRSQDWKRINNGSNPRIRTGYEIQFGRGLHPNFKRHTRYSTPALAWVSTLSLYEPQPGTILHGGPDSAVGRADLGLMLADINEEGTLYPPVTSVAHASRGYSQRYSPAGKLLPSEVGSEGGNLGFVDGSIHWRNFADMNAHNNHQSRTNVLAWW